MRNNVESYLVVTIHPHLLYLVKFKFSKELFYSHTFTRVMSFPYIQLQHQIKQPLLFLDFSKSNISSNENTISGCGVLEYKISYPIIVTILYYLSVYLIFIEHYLPWSPFEVFEDVNVTTLVIKMENLYKVTNQSNQKRQVMSSNNEIKKIVEFYIIAFGNFHKVAFDRVMINKSF